MYEAGVSDSTEILLTIEWQNFPQNFNGPLLSANKSMQSVILKSDGFSIDAPPQYAMAIGDWYIDWMIDAIKWGKNNGLITAWICSPHFSGSNFNKHTEQIINVLKSNNAMPEIVIVENYTTKKDYLNVVGNDRDINTVLGVAFNIIKNEVVK
jgi:protoheme ferro-lyase